MFAPSVWQILNINRTSGCKGACGGGGGSLIECMYSVEGTGGVDSRCLGVDHTYLLKHLPR